MKKTFLVLLITCLTLHGYSQISYEKGYYINNLNQKIDCYIKNMDWKNNPDNFEFKLTPDGPSEIANINTVKEFGLINTSKYVRHTVKIDRSPETANQLTHDKAPIYNEEQKFLNVLIEGKASLYLYEAGNLKRYFYTTDSLEVEPLVFKSFLKADNKVGQNNEFKQQLWNNLKCPSFKMNRMESLEYNDRSLIKLFEDYNECIEEDFVSYQNKTKANIYHITLRPRFNNSSLLIENPASRAKDTDFGSNSGFGFGIELEYILPFNKNKWSISIEPTYQRFDDKGRSKLNKVFNEELFVSVDYRSIELPISLRHYFFLNNDSKIFANISYTFNVRSDVSIEFERGDGIKLTPLNGKSGNNYGFGVGYKFKDRYSLEIRYLTSREILENYMAWDSKLQTTSFILGYTIF
ncbi:outer membrane beta-barrel protein [Gelidibacter sp.]|uniref:outer membrane beta-barrel protein n=1 Tax=Gelidibacter sp. TaxID=2018083 RepID=UPI002C2AEE06|nr:outer membrane beta-barrel protein [Gelidibacter sp.]HUH26844.1 outer membrane beta-barrel protein [Gelidibacter sp.]